MHLLYSWDLSIVLHMEVNNETLVDIRYPSADYIIATGSRKQMPNIINSTKILGSAEMFK